MLILSYAKVLLMVILMKFNMVRIMKIKTTKIAKTFEVIYKPHKQQIHRKNINA